MSTLPKNHFQSNFVFSSRIKEADDVKSGAVDRVNLSTITATPRAFSHVRGHLRVLRVSLDCLWSTARVKWGKGGDAPSLMTEKKLQPSLLMNTSMNDRV